VAGGQTVDETVDEPAPIPPPRAPATGHPRHRHSRSGPGGQSPADHEARLDADAVARWRAIVADRPPLSPGQIQAIAEILRRIDTRLAAMPVG
jgi:hypothetical protein